MNINNIKTFKKLIKEAKTIVETTSQKKLPKIKYQLTNNKNLFGSANSKHRIIRISKYIAKYYNRNEIINVLIHEMFHILSPGDNHGGQWKKLANKFNNSIYPKKYGQIKSTYQAKEELKSSYKYYVRCKKCNKIIRRAIKSKLIKYPNRYRCPECKGILISNI